MGLVFGQPERRHGGAGLDSLRISYPPNRLSGEFGSSPAIIVLRLKNISGGPTMPCAA